MKTRKLYCIVSALLIAMTTAVSCAGINSLTDEEATALGWGIGRVAGHYINN